MKNFKRAAAILGVVVLLAVCCLRMIFAFCGGLMSLAIFAFSSYPLQLPEFWVVLIFLGVMRRDIGNPGTRCMTRV